MKMGIQGLGNVAPQKSYQASNNQSEAMTKHESRITQKAMNNFQEDIKYIPNVQEKTVIETIEKANKSFEGRDKELAFSVHEKTKQIMVKIIDKATKEVLKELPPEKILDMVASMCEAAGIFVDEKR
ncbi:flagellar protein FlaG [Cellulosilyticum sp. I15G10I2]|uniref:flagellar protein FlaG n=1 Tax=Cellulosilyticum sp. I15G10I2 TaxID=1892843 RepID=UPI00085C7D9B|nr:flagellar protein FlaG [Cellulosilyticum sp. I15G10I2]